MNFVRSKVILKDPIYVDYQIDRITATNIMQNKENCKKC